MAQRASSGNTERFAPCQLFQAHQLTLIMLLAAFTWMEKESITDLYHCIPESVPLSLRLLPPPQSRLNIFTEHTSFGKQIPGMGDKSSQCSDCLNCK